MQTDKHHYKTVARMHHWSVQTLETQQEQPDQKRVPACSEQTSTVNPPEIATTTMITLVLTTVWWERTVIRLVSCCARVGAHLAL